MAMSMAWSTPSPCIRVATTKPAHAWFALAVTNQFQRRPTPQDDADRHDNSGKGVGALGRTVLTALESNPQSSKFSLRGGQYNSSSNSSIQIQCSNSKQQKQESESEGRDVLLSGSDVLRALQRATAHKIEKKRRDNPSSNTVVRSRRGTEQEEDNWDYSSARPICIKTDWTTRLDELEKRLQEVADTAT